MKSATCVFLYSSSAAFRLLCLIQKNSPVMMAIKATTPTTTPPAMAATFVEPPESDFCAEAVPEALVAGDAGLVTTIVRPGDTSVTTVGGADVVVELSGEESGRPPPGLEPPPPKFVTWSSVPVRYTE